MTGARSVPPSLRAAGVTPREAEVLGALAERLTNAEIADRLSISVRTVETHVSSLMEKFDGADRIALVGVGRAAAVAQLAAEPRRRPSSSLLGSAAGRTAFVGREAERVVLRAALDEVSKGRGGIVLIGGEPGIGKTRLAEELMREADARGVSVLCGHSYEAAGASSYVALTEILEGALAQAEHPETFRRDILGDAAAEVARVLPRLRRMFPDLPVPLQLPPEQERQYLFGCLTDVLGRIAAGTPTVIVHDDLQWADESSLAFLEHLAPALADHAMLIVATYRDTDVGRPLADTFGDLRRRRLAQRLTLGGLTVDEVSAFVAALAGAAPSTDVAGALWSGTEGNVFFLEEVVRDLLARGALAEFGGGPTAGRLDVPEGVRLVTTRRLDRLSAATRTLLTDAAVAGRVFSFALLRELATSNDDEALLDALDEASGAALIREAPGEAEFLFAHELIRQTLIAGLSGPRRHRAHLRSAQALIAVWAADPDARAAEIAHHLAEAGPEADPAELFDYSLRAGRRALESSSYRAAFESLNRAHALSGIASAPDRAELAAALARTHFALGNIDAAVVAWSDSIDAYARLRDTVAVGRICRDAGVALTYAGRLVEQDEMFCRGLAALGDGGSAAHVRLLASRGMAAAIFGESVRGWADLAAARALAQTLGDDVLGGIVGANEAIAGHATMQPAVAVRAGLAAAVALRPSSEPWPLIDGLVFTGLSQVSLGEFADSEPLLDEADRLIRRVGHYAPGFVHRAVAPREFYRTGDLAAFETMLHEEIDLISTHMGGGWIGLSYVWLSLIRELEGDLTAAESWARRAGDGIGGSGYLGFATSALVRCLAAAGRREDILDVVDAAVLPVAGRVSPNGSWGLLFSLVEALTALGERELPARWYELVVESSEVNEVVIGHFAPGHLVARIAGIAAAAGGAFDRADRHFRVALTQAETLPHQLERIETRRSWAAMLLERSGPDDVQHARLLLQEAADLSGRFRMPARADQIAAALAALP